MEPLLFQTPDVCTWTLLNVPNIYICCFLFHGKCVGVHGTLQLFSLIVTSIRSRLTCSMQHSLPYHFKIIKAGFQQIELQVPLMTVVHKWQLHDIGVHACRKRFSTCQGGSTRNIKKSHASWPWRCTINRSTWESCTSLVHMAIYTSILQSKTGGVEGLELGLELYCSEVRFKQATYLIGQSIILWFTRIWFAYIQQFNYIKQVLSSNDVHNTISGRVAW